MEVKLQVAFKIRQTVYLTTDPDQRAHVVTGYTVRDTSVLYLVSLGSAESTHYDFELSDAKDVLKATSN